MTLTESVPKNSPKMQSPVIHLHGIASIFDLLAEPISSSIPQTFEELKIAHGFVLYSTTIKNDTSDPVVLTVPHLRDRAQVFIDKVCNSLKIFIKLVKKSIYESKRND